MRHYPRCFRPAAVSDGWAGTTDRECDAVPSIPESRLSHGIRDGRRHECPDGPDERPHRAHRKAPGDRGALRGRQRRRQPPWCLQPLAGPFDCLARLLSDAPSHLPINRQNGHLARSRLYPPNHRTSHNVYYVKSCLKALARWLAKPLDADVEAASANYE